MDAISESSPGHPVLTRQAPVLTRPAERAPLMADAIHALLGDAKDSSLSDSSDSGLGMADAATALWTRFHKFDAADPCWPDRDRFVLCAGHGMLLLYALIHLTGHDGLTFDDVRECSQSQIPIAAHPDYGHHPAVEASAGAAGQGLAVAVGMALAERNMAARFGKSLVDHRTWVVASAADLTDGVSHEVASLAGHLGLAKLVVLYDDPCARPGGTAGATDDDSNSEPGPGDDTGASYGEDVLKRFNAYGWATKRVDGHDPDQISAALSFAVRSRKPTLIACRTNAGAAPH